MAKILIALVRMLVPNMLRNGDALAIVIQTNKNQSGRADNGLFMAVNIELPSFQSHRNAFGSDAVDLAVELDQVVLLHRRLEEHLLHLEGDHIWTVTNFIDEGHSEFVDPAQHDPTEKVVVHSEIVFFADFGSQKFHEVKIMGVLEWEVLFERIVMYIH